MQYAPEIIIIDIEMAFCHFTAPTYSIRFGILQLLSVPTPSARIVCVALCVHHNSENFRNYKVGKENG